MPFTLAHPAAVIPIHRYLGPWTVPSALVIGSITPDLAYILPAGLSRLESHSAAALIWFCLPAGCAVYLLFHLVLKRPLLSLAPPWIGCRLTGLDGGDRGLPCVSWMAVALSVLLGAVTHLGWDAFTHRGAPMVRAFDSLSVRLFAVGSYEVFPYKVLQHGGTLAGVVVLGWWIRRWLRAAPAGLAPAFSLTRRERFVAFAALGMIPSARGIVPFIGSGEAIPAALGRGVLSTISAFSLVLVAYGAWWNLWLMRGRRRGRFTNGKSEDHHLEV